MQSSSPQRNRDEFRLPALDRALDLLETLGVSHTGLTLSEIGRQLRIAKSSAHYLVYALLKRGYLQRDPDGHRFEIGPRAFDFLNLAPEDVALRRLTSPHIQELTEALHLAAFTAVRRGRQGMVLDVKDFTPRWSPAWIGNRFYLHATAQGKALISHLADAEIDSLFGDRPLGKLTPRTIVSLEALKVHLAEVRRQGFAFNNEEDSCGGRSIAAPVFNHTGEVIAALAVAGPVNQLPDWLVPKLAEKVISVARDITRKLAT